MPLHVCGFKLIIMLIHVGTWTCLCMIVCPTLTGGRQFKITTHDLIVINRIAADMGEKIILEKVQYTHVHSCACTVHVQYT